MQKIVPKLCTNEASMTSMFKVLDSTVMWHLLQQFRLDIQSDIIASMTQSYWESKT